MRTLAEDLMLFALDDAKGTTDWRNSSVLPYGLAGALLADLALRERVELHKKQKIAVLDDSATGDDLLDDGLRLIATSTKQHNAKRWVETFNGKVKKLRDRLEERLVSQGILRREEHRVFFVLPTERYPTSDPSVERGLREQVRAVLLDGESPDPRTAVLISLLKSTGLLDRVFSKDERKIVKSRVKAVIEGDEAGAVAGAAAKAAADAAAAVTAAVIAATAGGAAAASSGS